MLYQSVDTKKNTNDKLILVGIISSPHGINGQVLVKSYTEQPENIVKLPIIDQNNNIIKLKLVKINPKEHLICSLENCTSRTQAEAYIRKSLYCLRSNFSEIIDEDEFYIEDLIGLEVIDHNNIPIGRVLNVANYGGGDIIEIMFFKDKKTQMLPFTKEFFPDITKQNVKLVKMLD